MSDQKSDHAAHSQDEKDKNAELLTHPSYEELMQKLDEADAKAQDYWDRLLRLQAEKDNLVRRAERDVSNAHKYALEKFALDLLPIIDSLELCLTTVSDEMQANAKSVIEGVNLTLKMFYSSMEKFGIKQINPVSQPFEAEYQQAISMQEDATVKPGTVLSVLQKGYTLNERLLRPALVVVAKNPD